MVDDGEARPRYALSFTSGALLAREAGIAAELHLRERDWTRVRRRIREENLLQARTGSSSARRAREATQRLSVLSDAELEFLVEAAPSERSLLLWVAACRCYALIGDFAEDVVRERFLKLTPALSPAHFDAYVQEKSLWHPELSELAPSTAAKLRQNVFRMLAEAGLLAHGVIQPALPTARLLELLRTHPASDDTRFLPLAPDSGDRP